MLTEADLSNLLASLEIPSVSREVLLERFGGSVELVKHGEARVALENLCDNLDEFAVPLTVEVRDRLAVWCRGNGVGPDRVRLLDALIANRPRAG